MNFVKLTYENIECEHICCAIANTKDVRVMSNKKFEKILECKGCNFYIKIQEEKNNE